MNKFKIGDSVRLRSEDPVTVMTIVADKGDDCYLCAWYDGKPQEESFLSEGLERDEDEMDYDGNAD